MPTAQAPQPNALRERILAFDHALTAPEVSTLFSLTPATVYRLAKEGVIPNFRIGTSVRFDPRLLADWYGQQ